MGATVQVDLIGRAGAVEKIARAVIEARNFDLVQRSPCRRQIIRFASPCSAARCRCYHEHTKKEFLRPAWPFGLLGRWVGNRASHVITISDAVRH